MNDDHFSLREMLIRMEGKIDVIQSEAGRTADDIRDLRERAHGHSNRLQALEASNHLREGEQKGFEKSLRPIYALATVCAGGVVTAAVKMIVGG